MGIDGYTIQFAFRSENMDLDSLQIPMVHGLDIVLCSQLEQKLFGLIITLGEALAYLLSGMYGEISELGAFNSLVIIF